MGNKNEIAKMRKIIVEHIEKHGEVFFSETNGEYKRLPVITSIYCYVVTHYQKLDSIEVFNYYEDDNLEENDKIIEDLYRNLIGE